MWLILNSNLLVLSLRKCCGIKFWEKHLHIKKLEMYTRERKAGELLSHQSSCYRMYHIRKNGNRIVNCRFTKKTRVESGRSFSCASWSPAWNWMWPASRSASSLFAKKKPLVRSRWSFAVCYSFWYFELILNWSILSNVIRFLVMPKRFIVVKWYMLL